MKKLTMLGMLVAAGALIVTAGCGGGGGSTPPPPQPTTASLKISTSGTLPNGTQIGTVDVTIVLPSGVTVAAEPDPLNPNALITAPGVVEASGVAAVSDLSLNTYTPADSANPGKVIVRIINANGFGTGEFVTVNGNIAAGNFPKASDFSLPSDAFTLRDINGVDIDGLTAGFTADIR